jgi:hypothetical protein
MKKRIVRNRSAHSWNHGYEFKSDWEEDSFNPSRELGSFSRDEDSEDDPFSRWREDKWSGEDRPKMAVQ